MKENLELLSRSLYRLPVAELTDEQLHAVVARAVLARLQPAITLLIFLFIHDTKTSHYFHIIKRLYKNIDLLRHQKWCKDKD